MNRKSRRVSQSMSAEISPILKVDSNISVAHFSPVEPYLHRSNFCCTSLENRQPFDTRRHRTLKSAQQQKTNWGLKMSEARKCPKCGAEVEVGYLSNAPRWRRGRSLWSIGWGERVFGYTCRNCGYIEFYLEK